MINETNVKMFKRQKQFGKNSSVKTTLRDSSTFRDGSNNLDLLLSCENDWNRLSSLRTERARNIRYKNGDQWGDLVFDPKSRKWMREDVFLSQQGKVPLKQNYIQQFVRNLHGQLLSNKSQSIVHARAKDDAELSDMLTNTLHACHKLNKADSIDIAVLEDLLLGGIACTKVRYSFFSEKNRADGCIDLVGVGRLFFNTDVEDPRLNDLRRIGEIHDYTMTDLIANFANTKADELELRKVYSSVLESYDSIGGTDMRKEKHPSSFLLPDTFDKCRVVEVWERLGRWVTYVHDYADGTEQITSLSMQDIERVNAERIAIGISVGMASEDIATMYAVPKFEYYWRASYLTPTGLCIKRFETPFAHESHPYTLVTMPMIDGSIKSVLGDLIDIQRYINRLYVMKDFMMSTSAKGVLMLPEECIPEGMTADDFTEQWAMPNGVIPYKASKLSSVLPTQISANNADNGTSEMLSLQTNLMQQISGISSAIQGETPRSNTPSSLYAQQAQNSTLNYRILFEVFNGYVEQRDEKLLKVLMQYYTDKRHVDISGSAYKEVAKFYDPVMASKIVDFNLVVSQSNDTPVYRQVANEALMKFLEAGLITFDVFLDNSAMPFAEKLKADMRQAKESMQQQGVADPTQEPEHMPTRSHNGPPE